MIQLSYSTLKMVHEASHNYLNKLQGLKPEDHDYYHDGKVGHDRVQAHVSGKIEVPELVHLKYRFPIVEEKDFDERCKFDCTLTQLIQNATPSAGAYTPKEDYNIIGYFDGTNVKEKNFLEIKISNTVWTVKKFFDLMQRKIYGLADPRFKFAICVSGVRDITLWDRQPVKVYTVPIMQRERVEAIDWILSGIKIIESGDFSGGLDENGKCTNPNCYYGVNCSFK